MKIKVTENDIRQGVQGSTMNCPIAKAVNRETGLYSRVTALRIEGFSTREELLAVYATGREQENKPFKVWDTPMAAQDFIHAFDTAIENEEKALIQPVEFEL